MLPQSHPCGDQDLSANTQLPLIAGCSQILESPAQPHGPVLLAGEREPMGCRCVPRSHRQELWLKEGLPESYAPTSACSLVFFHLVMGFALPITVLPGAPRAHLRP